MTTITRRDFIARTTLATGTLCLGGLPLTALAAGEEPHFFLQIYFPGGFDPSYLFDARPLAMTAAGQIQNYLGEEPSPWIGANGAQTLATRLVQPLAPYRDRFSVL